MDVTAPIAFAAPSRAESAGTSGREVPDGAAGSTEGGERTAPVFPAMLDAAIASTGPTQAPPAPALEAPLVDLVVDGQWVFELPEDADADAVADSADGPAGVDPALTLEKELDAWARAVGRKGGTDPGAGARIDGPGGHRTIERELDTVDVEAPVDGALPLGASLDPVGVASLLAAGSWHSSSDDGGSDVAPNPANADADGPASHQAPGATRPAPGEPTAAVDADTLIDRLGPFHRAVEIGGFVFPPDIDPTKDGARPLEILPQQDGKATGADEPGVLPRQLEGARVVFSEAGSAGSRDGAGSGRDRREDRPPVPARTLEALGAKLVEAVTKARDEIAGSKRTAAGADREPAAPSESKPAAAPVAPVVGPHRTAPAPTDGATVAAPGAERPSGPSLDLPVATPRRPDRITVDLKDDAGDHGRLTLSLGGGGLRATILPNDQALADRLTVGIRELRQSLEERGFPEPRLTVQAPKGEAGHLQPARDAVVVELGGSGPKSGRPGCGEDDGRERRQQSGQPDRRSGDQQPFHRRPRLPHDEGRPE
jgi:hypothetical protein